jgi:hypothetical protein
VLLSAALIVRNEERCLGRCLASIEAIVDEIIVVDTGSEDGSVELARSFGATVLQRRWDNDFSAPRNVGLEQVHGAWVLYIGADEYLEPKTRGQVENELADHSYVAHRVLHRYNTGCTPYREYRIWRNRPDIRFRGVIHETTVPSILQIASEEGLRIGQPELVLGHDGYVGDRAAKNARNLPLLLEEAERDPDRTYLWDHIGRIYEDAGDTGAACQAWRHGVEIVRANGVREPADSLVFCHLILANVDARQLDEALVDEALQLFPTYALILWAAALDAAARGDHMLVIERVNQLLTVSPDFTAWCGMTLDERIAREWARNVRGGAHLALGQFEMAANDFAAALAHDPSSMEYRVKLQLARAKAAQG